MTNPDENKIKAKHVRKLIYADERGRYNVFRIIKDGETTGKELWVCCCGKEFKQHARFHKHNCENCLTLTRNKP